MLSKKLYFVFGLGAIAVIILVAVVFGNELEYRWMSVFVIPFIVLLVMSYVFSPQIDWWWYQRNPPELPGVLGNLLLEYFPYYRNLSVDNKKRFRQRVAMYLEARGFFAMRGAEQGEVPLDMKTMIAANVVMLTFGKKDFILKKFERIFIYLQAFPTPNHQYLHGSEINEEDECLLFSGEHLMLSFRQPERFYNIATHEYAKAFEMTYSKYDYPDFEEAMWGRLGKEHIIKYVGIPEEKLDLRGVGVNFFFQQPEKLKELLPHIFERYSMIFNQNPMEQKDPVLDKKVIENVP